MFPIEDRSAANFGFVFADCTIALHGDSGGGGGPICSHSMITNSSWNL